MDNQQIKVYSGGDYITPFYSGDLGTFLRDNDFDAQETNAVVLHLKQGRPYVFGGGAAPVTAIKAA